MKFVTRWAEENESRAMQNKKQLEEEQTEQARTRNFVLVRQHPSHGKSRPVSNHMHVHDRPTYLFTVNWTRNALDIEKQDIENALTETNLNQIFLWTSAKARKRYP